MSALTHPLDALPFGATPSRVVAEPCVVDGRAALRVALSPDVRKGQLGVDFGDFPTFVALSAALKNGTIEVDVLARLLPDAPAYARGFIGLAYRIQDDNSAYESVYVRPLNGRGYAPPPPRDARAIQYYAYPDWQYERLRETYPDGRFEGGADLALNQWTQLRLDIDERRVTVAINGQDSFVVAEAMVEPAAGGIGLWVDIGTEGYFANLRVMPR